MHTHEVGCAHSSKERVHYYSIYATPPLPFVRREGVRLMKSSYSTSDEAARVIDEDLRKFYTSRGRAVDAQVTGAVTALQSIYRRNVFPVMKVTFGTYPDNIGRMTSSGCFRCHDGSLTAKRWQHDQRGLRVLPQADRET
jgi:hypothetical protein